MKERLDKILVNRGLTDSRQKARALIMAGFVFSGEKKLDKAGIMLESDVDVHIKKRMPFVGRGGLKLHHALKEFQVDVSGLTALDLGCSTGGFTDCLLQNGAEKVYAVDVDPRQFDWKLSHDPRVNLIKKNARYLLKEDIPSRIDLVVMDLSFISVLKVLPAVRRMMEHGRVIPLIKPQFEAGRSHVGKKGIVKDPELHSAVLFRVVEGASLLDFNFRAITASPIRGQKGNREFFLLFSIGEDEYPDLSLTESIKEAVWNESG